MIKLNNKNITYVALADSNNSLKAPKEIWYADSSNSVKLVYRRKDALIEGEDYEKYNLLNSYTDEGVTLPAQGADISVNPIPLDNKVLTIELGKISRNVSIWGKSPWFIPMWCMYVANQYIMQLQERNGNDNTVHNMTYSWNTSNIVTLDFQNKVARLGNNSFNIDGSNYNFDGFHSAMWQNPRTVGKIKISDELHLVPCKLLKSVPKWLDANGIRRQVGECGMIDLVSGKFYGNVNSVGTFTVENYYERKEWLVGDGSAYIDTLHLANEGLDWETHVSNLSFKKHFVWNRVSPTEYPAISLYHSVATNGVVRVQNNYTNTIELQNQTNYDYIVAAISNGAVINGAQYIRQSMSENISNKSIKLFYCDIDEYGKRYVIIDNGGNSQDVKCAYFRFIDANGKTIQNLIPCKLTNYIPASMDANGIARPAGTCGMWDLVSDRFYGNVANSGTFKAVNLAENVDYEVHQWLKTGSGYPHIQVAYDYNTDSGAYIETRYKCNYSNRDFDMFIGFSINQNNNIGIRIFNAENKTFVDYHKTENGVLSSSRIIKSQSNINAERYIKATLNNLIIDDTEYPTINWGRGFDSINIRGPILYTNQRDNDVHYAETKLRENNVEYDLIPVKLLRSIPSKYDANGIARQAGECGMYDTVNDVFYGNVASSGTFTVSD